MNAGHGGQILLSESTRGLADEDCVDLGRHQLKGLARPEQIFQLRYAGGQSDFPPLRTVLASTAGNLPLVWEPLFGRETEVDSVSKLMDNHRLVTLTGPGGVGKTRLAMEVAGAGERSARHGVWLIQLAPLAPNIEIYATDAATLSIQAEGGRSLADSRSRTHPRAPRSTAFRPRGYEPSQHDSRNRIPPPPSATIR